MYKPRANKDSALFEKNMYGRFSLSQFGFLWPTSFKMLACTLVYNKFKGNALVKYEMLKEYL